MRLLHGEAGAAGCETMLAAIIQVGGDNVGAGLQAGGVDLRGGITARNFCTSGIPTIGDGALGIEIGAAGSGGHRLGGKDFCRLYRTSGGGRKRRLSTTEVKDKASLQAHAGEVRTRNSGRTKVLFQHKKTGGKRAKRVVGGHVKTKTP